VSVALFTQHYMRMLRNILSSVASLVPQYFFPHVNQTFVFAISWWQWRW